METSLNPPQSTERLLEVFKLLNNGSPRLNVRQAAVLCLVALNPGMTQKWMSESLRVTQTAISQILIALDDVGWTRLQEQPGPFSPSLYFITGRGQTFLQILTHPLNVAK